MRDELLQLNQSFEIKLNKMISSSVSEKEEMDGQYLFQFQDIVKSLLMVKDDSDETLQELLQIR